MFGGNTVNESSNVMERTKSSLAKYVLVNASMEKETDRYKAIHKEILGTRFVYLDKKEDWG